MLTGGCEGVWGLGHGGVASGLKTAVMETPPLPDYTAAVAHVLVFLVYF